MSVAGPSGSGCDDNDDDDPPGWPLVVPPSIHLFVHVHVYVHAHSNEGWKVCVCACNSRKELLLLLRVAQLLTGECRSRNTAMRETKNVDKWAFINKCVQYSTNTHLQMYAIYVYDYSVKKVSDTLESNVSHSFSALFGSSDNVQWNRLDEECGDRYYVRRVVGSAFSFRRCFLS